MYRGNIKFTATTPTISEDSVNLGRASFSHSLTLSIHRVALQALEAALDGFSRGLLRCCTQGPLQTLLGADGLLQGLVDACVGAREALRPLEDGALPTLLSSQARLLGRQLEGAGVNVGTLRRLRSTLYELEEEVGCCADAGTAWC